jgi:hypothetical protein
MQLDSAATAASVTRALLLSREKEKAETNVTRYRFRRAPITPAARAPSIASAPVSNSGAHRRAPCSFAPGGEARDLVVTRT